MFGLEFLSTGLLYLAALDTNASASQIECIPQKKLLIDVVLVRDDVRYDFSKKTLELNSIGKGAYSPYGSNHFNTEFKGLTAGKKSLNYNIEFYFEKYKDEGLACLQIQKIKITMNYAPTIYISTKFKMGTPIFNKILEHEKEHVKITQRVLSQYVNILEERLRNELKYESISGPFADDDMEREKQKLQGRVKRISAKVLHLMQEESQRRNNLFDDAELNDSIEYNQGVARRLEEVLKIKN